MQRRPTCHLCQTFIRYPYGRKEKVGGTGAAGAGRMDKDPNRFWWLSLVLIAAGSAGLWAFERAMFPANTGAVGAVIGFLLGTALAAILEDYLDQNLK